jgi:xanthine dehydrogenase accessory factor
MNEVRALVRAFGAAVAAGERCALATIVSVEGSSYRRPGARLLVRESGETEGSISAGCLEGDVIERAKRVIRDGRSELAVYSNASTSDEMAWGLGLGCNGTVNVLIEPLSEDSQCIDALRRSLDLPADEGPIKVATVYECTDPAIAGFELGGRLIVGENGEIRTDRLDEFWASMLAAKIGSGLVAGPISCDLGDAAATVFVEHLMPPTPLMVFGAGPDAVPIVELAQGLGWSVEVVDPQCRPVSRERFSIADMVTLARPEDVVGSVKITPRTLAIVMSHNYVNDRQLLQFLLASPARYIGVMGPRKRTERMLEEIGSADPELISERSDMERLHAPIGLDIAANSPAEVALSIVAEMRAVLNGRSGGMLRDRRGSIHGSPDDAKPEKFSTVEAGDGAIG